MMSRKTRPGLESRGTEIRAEKVSKRERTKCVIGEIIGVMVNERPWNVCHEMHNHTFLGGTGDKLPGGAENGPSAAIRLNGLHARSRTTLPHPPPLPIVLFSTLNAEFVTPTIPSNFLPAPGPHVWSSILSAPPSSWAPPRGDVNVCVGPYESTTANEKE